MLSLMTRTVEQRTEWKNTMIQAELHEATVPKLSKRDKTDSVGSEPDAA